MEVSFAPEAKMHGLVLQTVERKDCTTIGFNVGIQIGRFNVGGSGTSPEQCTTKTTKVGTNKTTKVRGSA